MANIGFTRNEKVDMLLILGECRRNSTEACRLYAQRYPNRRHPSRTYFRRIELQIRQEPDEHENNFIVNEEAEINVLAFVEFNPNASTREIGQECNISRESARKILHKHHFRSYKYNLHQHLYDEDYNRRLTYCNWFLEKQLQNNNFVFNILFSDESRFTNNGMFNRNNLRFWTSQNPRLVRQGHFQERFGLNVWMGILGTRLIGPIFFDGRLTGERYLGFLQNNVEPHIENVIPLEVVRMLHFQQDGAPPHNSRQVVAYLDNIFGERWIGTNGPVRWPPRSPDLTPLDFYLWGHLKNQVYSTPPTTLEDLRGKIQRAINRITEEELRRVMRSTEERARMCVRLNGQHFEHFIE